MSYEVRTPLLVDSVAAAKAVIDGVQDGSMETREAMAILGGARVLQSAVREDVRARIAAPKIAAQEARLIQGDSQHALASA